MKVGLIFTKSYNKKARKFFKKNPHLIETYRKKLKLLRINPQHPSLRMHLLEGRLKKLHSVSINMQYLVGFEFIIQENKRILLINVGDHAAAHYSLP